MTTVNLYSLRCACSLLKHTFEPNNIYNFGAQSCTPSTGIDPNQDFICVLNPASRTTTVQLACIPITSTSNNNNNINSTIVNEAPSWRINTRYVKCCSTLIAELDTTTSLIDRVDMYINAYTTYSQDFLGKAAALAASVRSPPPSVTNFFKFAIDDDDISGSSGHQQSQTTQQQGRTNTAAARNDDDDDDDDHGGQQQQSGFDPAAYSMGAGGFATPRGVVLSADVKQAIADLTAQVEHWKTLANHSSATSKQLRRRAEILDDPSAISLFRPQNRFNAAGGGGFSWSQSERELIEQCRGVIQLDTAMQRVKMLLAEHSAENQQQPQQPQSQQPQQQQNSLFHDVSAACRKLATRNLHFEPQLNLALALLSIIGGSSSSSGAATASDQNNFAVQIPAGSAATTATGDSNVVYIPKRFFLEQQEQNDPAAPRHLCLRLNCTGCQNNSSNLLHFNTVTLMFVVNTAGISNISHNSTATTAQMCVVANFPRALLKERKASEGERSVQLCTSCFASQVNNSNAALKHQQDRNSSSCNGNVHIARPSNLVPLLREFLHFSFLLCGGSETGVKWVCRDATHMVAIAQLQQGVLAGEALKSELARVKRLFGAADDQDGASSSAAAAAAVSATTPSPPSAARSPSQPNPTVAPQQLQQQQPSLRISNNSLDDGSSKESPSGSPRRGGGGTAAAATTTSNPATPKVGATATATTAASRTATALSLLAAAPSKIYSPKCDVCGATSDTPGDEWKCTKPGCTKGKTWQKNDDAKSGCNACGASFNSLTRRHHHCYCCGFVMCAAHSEKAPSNVPVPWFEWKITTGQRMCPKCKTAMEKFVQQEQQQEQQQRARSLSQKRSETPGTAPMSRAELPPATTPATQHQQALPPKPKPRPISDIFIESQANTIREAQVAEMVALVEAGKKGSISSNNDNSTGNNTAATSSMIVTIAHTIALNAQLQLEQLHAHGRALLENEFVFECLHELQQLYNGAMRHGCDELVATSKMILLHLSLPEASHFLTPQQQQNHRREIAARATVDLIADQFSFCVEKRRSLLSDTSSLLAGSSSLQSGKQILHFGLPSFFAEAAALAERAAVVNVAVTSSSNSSSNSNNNSNAASSAATALATHQFALAQSAKARSDLAALLELESAITALETDIAKKERRLRLIAEIEAAAAEEEEEGLLSQGARGGKKQQQNDDDDDNNDDTAKQQQQQQQDLNAQESEQHLMETLDEAAADTKSASGFTTATRLVAADDLLSNYSSAPRRAEEKTALTVAVANARERLEMLRVRQQGCLQSLSRIKRATNMTEIELPPGFVPRCASSIAGADDLGLLLLDTSDFIWGSEPLPRSLAPPPCALPNCGPVFKVSICTLKGSGTTANRKVIIKTYPRSNPRTAEILRREAALKRHFLLHAPTTMMSSMHSQQQQQQQQHPSSATTPAVADPFSSPLWHPEGAFADADNVYLVFHEPSRTAVHNNNHTNSNNTKSSSSSSVSFQAPKTLQEHIDSIPQGERTIQHPMFDIMLSLAEAVAVLHKFETQMEVPLLASGCLDPRRVLMVPEEEDESATGLLDTPSSSAFLSSPAASGGGGGGLPAAAVSNLSSNSGSSSKKKRIVFVPRLWHVADCVPPHADNTNARLASVLQAVTATSSQAAAASTTTTSKQVNSNSNPLAAINSLSPFEIRISDIFALGKCFTWMLKQSALPSSAAPFVHLATAMCQQQQQPTATSTTSSSSHQQHLSSAEVVKTSLHAALQKLYERQFKTETRQVAAEAERALEAERKKLKAQATAALPSYWTMVKQLQQAATAKSAQPPNFATTVTGSKLFCTAPASALPASQLQLAIYESKFMEEQLRNAWPSVFSRSAVASVERVENLPLWQQFASYRELIAAAISTRLQSTFDPATLISNALPDLHTQYWKLRPDSSLSAPLSSSSSSPASAVAGGLNELYLFHGTSKEAARSIIVGGFDTSRSGAAAGAVFGEHAAYFTDDPSFAKSYAAKAASSGSGVLLVARVVLGFVSQAVGSATRAKSAPQGFDSLQGRKSTGSPNEFIVYKSQQAIVEYVVHFN